MDAGLYRHLAGHDLTSGRHQRLPAGSPEVNAFDELQSTGDPSGVRNAMNTANSIRKFIEHSLPAVGLAIGDPRAEATGPAEDVSAPLPGEDLAEIVDQIVNVADDDLLGFRLGRLFHPSVLGIGGVVALQSPNLKTALEMLNRFSPLAPDWGIIRQSISGVNGSEATAMTFEPGWSDPFVRAQVVDAVWTAIVSLGRMLVGNQFAPTLIRLRRSAPLTATMQDFFRCPVQFGSEQNVLVLQTKLLTQPVAGFQQDMFHQLVTWANQLGNDADQESISAVVWESLHRGEFLLRRTARRLGVNERTIQRRLRSEGTSYQRLRDAVRLKMARVLLDTPDMTVQQIATKLGYSDSRAFRHAYKRWTGKSPREA